MILPVRNIYLLFILLVTAMSLSLVAILFILYAIWDVNYFLRCVFTLGYAHFFQKKRKVTEKTSIYGNYSTARFDELLVIFWTARPLHNARC